MALVDEIRAAARWVAERSAHVRIRAERLDGYADLLEREIAANPLDHGLEVGAAKGLGAGPKGLDNQPDPEVPAALSGATHEGRAAYALTLDAINFGSGWFPELRKPEGLSGYRTIERAIDERFARRGPWTARELSEITTAEVAAAIGQDPGLELMRLFTESLSDLGARIQADHEGRFIGPAGRAAGSAVELVEELAGWRCFRDSSTYQGRRVPFLKRAQIAAADLHRTGAAALQDLDRLTLFADNLVPHVLGLDGVLEFEPALSARIEAGELLERDAPEEVEMRACAVHAVELLSERLPGIAPHQLDRLLWNRGATDRYKSVPRPRCRTTAY